MPCNHNIEQELSSLQFLKTLFSNSHSPERGSRSWRIFSWCSLKGTADTQFIILNRSLSGRNSVSLSS